MGINVKKLNRYGGYALAMGALLSACATTEAPEPAPAVQSITELDVVIYEPVEEATPEPVVESVPSIDIAEWERMQAEAAAAAAANTIVETPAPIKKPRETKSALERAAETSDPDEAIKILAAADSSPKKEAMLLDAYKKKLAADKASGDSKGAAKALVFLSKVEARKGTQDSQLEALKGFAEAQSLDPANKAAPKEVSTLRSKLQSYADSLHKQAVTFFVEQDFKPAVSRWETVLLIDPGNSAARNWFTQAREALGR